MKNKPTHGYKPVKWLFRKEIDIPEEWDFVFLKDISKKIMKGIFDLNPENYIHKGIPFLRVSDIKENLLSLNSSVYISEELSRKYPNSELSSNDIVMAKVGSIYSNEKITKIPKTISKCNISQNMIGIKIDERKINSDYLLFVLLQNYPIIVTFSNATTLGSLRLDTLRNLKIPIPPIQEQQKIVSILSSVDSLISSYDKIIQTTKILKKGLMKQLFTKGIGHIKFKKVKLGGQIIEEIPQNWKIETMRNISKDGTQNGLAISVSDYGSGVPIVGMTKFYASEIFIDNDMKEVNISKKDKEKFSLKSFDLLFGRRSMDGKADGEAGKCVIIPRLSKNIIFESSLIRMSVKKEINPFFIYQLFKSHLGVKIMRRIIRVSAVSGISAGDLIKIKIPVPPKNEQDKIVLILSQYDNQANELESKKSNLEHLKKGLIQKLLTGKIRV